MWQDLLKALGTLKINLNILTSTRIGMTVNALRNTNTCLFSGFF
jgi:hypothetical protein